MLHLNERQKQRRVNGVIDRKFSQKNFAKVRNQHHIIFILVAVRMGPNFAIETPIFSPRNPAVEHAFLLHGYKFKRGLAPWFN